MSEYSSYMWSVPDWRTDEMYTELDNREQGIYRNLIDECWVRGSIDSNLEVLARFSREPLDYFLPVWAKISKKFHPIDGGKRLISARLEQDRRRLMHTAKFTEKRARKAANARWAKERAEKELHASSMAVASPKHAFEQCQIQTHTKEKSNLPNKEFPLLDSSPPVHSPPAKKRASGAVTVYTEDFEKFWRAYPKKVGKGDAFEQWQKNGHPGVDQIIATLELAKQTAKWIEKNGQYIPNPSTWLHQKRWDDEYIPVRNERKAVY